MATSPTAMTPLPTPPSRDDPTNFASRGDAFLGALPDFQTELNDVADVTYDNAVEANTSATTATTKASEAATSATNAANSATTATTKASEAATSATNAAASATTATTQAGIATTKASEAATSATNAANSATAAATSATNAANSAAEAEIFATQQLKGSSSTANTPGAGSKTFTMETGRSFVTGMYVSITSSGATGNRMSGFITSYNSSTGVLVVSVDSFTGSSERTDWVIGVASPVSDVRAFYTDISSNTDAVTFGRYRYTASCDLTAPPSPTDGDWVDVINTSGTTTPRILRNGQNINGFAENLNVDRNFAAFRIVFRAGYGWMII